MSIWLLVGLGGFIGALLRYWLSDLIQSGFITFPAGTLGVNFLGSFLLALIMYASEYRGVFNEEPRICLSIGVLGSYTTMSTFSYESIEAFTIPSQFTYLFNNHYSLDFVFEYQEMRKGVESRNVSTIFNSNFPKNKQFNRFIGIGLGKSPKWSVSLNIDYSNTDEHIVIENGRDNNIIEKNLGSILDTSFTWSSFGMVYNINQNYQLSLTYGSMRGGVLCSNGVCRYVQPFENGFKIGLVSTF